MVQASLVVPNAWVVAAVHPSETIEQHKGKRRVQDSSDMKRRAIDGSGEGIEIRKRIGQVLMFLRSIMHFSPTYIHLKNAQMWCVHPQVHLS